MERLSLAAAALIALGACQQAPAVANDIDDDAASPVANVAQPANPRTQPDAHVLAAENAAAAANGEPGPATAGERVPPPPTRSPQR